MILRSRQGRRYRAGPLGAAACLALALLAAFAPARADTLEVSAGEGGGYGRIVLTFSQPNKVATRLANGILVLTFSRPAAIRAERLLRDLPNYVAQVRRDPADAGLRLALSRPVRTNVLEAGEKVFVDLLPPDWKGMMPGLPPEVVAELARRAQAAEAKLRAGKPAVAPKTVTLSVAQLPTLTRLSFQGTGLPPGALRVSGREIEIAYAAPIRLETGEARAQLNGIAENLSAETGEGSGIIRLTVARGFEPRGFREDEAIVVDLAKPKATPERAARAAAPIPPPRPIDPTPPREPLSFSAEAARMPDPPPPAEPAVVPPLAPAAVAERAASPALPPPTPAAVSAPPTPVPATPAVVEASAAMSEGALALAFPFTARTPAAAFRRGQDLVVVFETGETLAPVRLSEEAARLAAPPSVQREGAFTTLTFRLPAPQLAGLAPQGTGWLLTIGGRGPVAAMPLTPTRPFDEANRKSLLVPLAGASAIHWLEREGERIAIATALAPTRAVEREQNFVEFGLLASAQGVAVLAVADDVEVRTDPEGVRIGRAAGLALSPEGGAPVATRVAEPVLDRERVAALTAGDSFARMRALEAAAAGAEGAALARARLELARFLVADQRYPEAIGVLASHFSGEPGRLRERVPLLLAGIAHVGQRRFAEGRRFLADPSIAEDPEAILWNAVADAAARRWPQARAGFERVDWLVERYPAALQADLRAIRAEAALEAGAIAAAESEVAALGELPRLRLGGQKLGLLKARLEEAGGDVDSALARYRQLADEAERPIAAEAVLRYATLGVKEGKLDAEAVLPRLETLAVTWRGDETEIATLGLLGRLYLKLDRYRDALLTAQRANRLFPDHPVARDLNEAAMQVFEELFLDGKADGMGAIEALALYYDFRDFMPIGRRGDEIVRRLADRLVSLDLLDRAGDLLQYQVDHRLNGVARATVAARLATVRLMDGKPLAALAALAATRLPELPSSIRRARLLLEARALSDLTRTELALEVLTDESGPEIDRLRADILWSARRWREAGEAHEAMLGTRWTSPEPLTDEERGDVMRAAIAFSLADETLGLDRLRSKFSAKMADSIDARTFALIAAPGAVVNPAFRQIARSVTSADTLAEFLNEYRKRYPEAASAVPAARAEPAPAEDAGSGRG